MSYTVFLTLYAQHPLSDQLMLSNNNAELCAKSSKVKNDDHSESVKNRHLSFEIEAASAENTGRRSIFKREWLVSVGVQSLGV